MTDVHASSSSSSSSPPLSTPPLMASSLYKRDGSIFFSVAERISATSNERPATSEEASHINSKYRGLLHPTSGLAGDLSSPVDATQAGELASCSSSSSDIEEASTPPSQSVHHLDLQAVEVVSSDDTFPIGLLRDSPQIVLVKKDKTVRITEAENVDATEGNAAQTASPGTIGLMDRIVSAAQKRKKSVAWATVHRPSCSSSPKHRYHPYSSSGGTWSTASRSPKQLLDSGFAVLSPARNSRGGQGEAASSSSPSTRRDSRNRRDPTSTTSENVFATLLAAAAQTSPGSGSSSSAGPRSILKKRAAHRRTASQTFSPGRKLFQPVFKATGLQLKFSAHKVATVMANLGSPSSSPRMAAGSPFMSPRARVAMSARKSPRTQAANGDKADKAAQDILAEITKANGSGRKHTVSFPDLLVHSLAGKGKSTAETTVQAEQPASTTSAATSTPAQSSTVGLFAPGLLPAPEDDPVLAGLPGINGPSKQADPRTSVISAMHTLKHSLCAPVWDDGNAYAASQANNPDAFESTPIDFPPRNLADSRVFGGLPPLDAASPILSAPVHLRELENAYAIIFTYVQAWLASPQCIEATLKMQNNDEQAPEVDELDVQFEALADVVLACLFREVNSALNPVPIPVTAEETGGPISTLSDLLAADSDDQVSSSPKASPLPTPSNKTKRHGRSTAETRRRRTELHVTEAALQAFGSLLADQRFWSRMSYDKLVVVLQELCAIPLTSALSGPKCRDILSSFNWLIASQTLTAKQLGILVNAESSATATSETAARPLHDALAASVLKAMMNSNKNGEKAKRVMSEGLRALRSLLLVAPKDILAMLVSEANEGIISHFLTSLLSTARPLRDNAALALAGVAWALTSGWSDHSVEGLALQARMHDRVSTEVYRRWSTALKPNDLSRLADCLNAACERGAVGHTGDFAVVRIVTNAMPILLGRRFRKMEHKGPHTWLRKAVQLQERDVSEDRLTHHIVAFNHVIYAWAAASKELATKSIVPAQSRETIASDGQDTEEALWGLGEKAMRVVSQNIDSLSNADLLENAPTSRANAAVALLTSFLYTFIGLSHQLSETTHIQGPYTGANRDCDRVWHGLIAGYLPRLFEVGTAAMHQTACSILLAVLGSADDTVTRDSWTLDRIVSSRLLGRNLSQSSQDPGLAAALLEMPTASDIPALPKTWLATHVDDIFQLIVAAAKAAVSLADEEAIKVDWHKSSDGTPILPNSLLNIVYSFLTLLRDSTGSAAMHDEDEFGTRVSTALVMLVEALSNDAVTLHGGDLAILFALIMSAESKFGTCNMDPLAERLWSRLPEEGCGESMINAFAESFGHIYFREEGREPALSVAWQDACSKFASLSAVTQDKLWSRLAVRHADAADRLLDILQSSSHEQSTVLAQLPAVLAHASIEKASFIRLVAPLVPCAVADPSVHAAALTWVSRWDIPADIDAGEVVTLLSPLLLAGCSVDDTQRRDALIAFARSTSTWRADVAQILQQLLQPYLPAVAEPTPLVDEAEPKDGSIDVDVEEDEVLPETFEETAEHATEPAPASAVIVTDVAIAEVAFEPQSSTEQSRDHDANAMATESVQIRLDTPTATEQRTLMEEIAEITTPTVPDVDKVVATIDDAAPATESCEADQSEHVHDEVPTAAPEISAMPSLSQIPDITADSSSVFPFIRYNHGWLIPSQAPQFTSDAPKVVASPDTSGVADAPLMNEADRAEDGASIDPGQQVEPMLQDPAASERVDDLQLDDEITVIPETQLPHATAPASTHHLAEARLENVSNGAPHRLDYAAQAAVQDVIAAAEVPSLDSQITHLSESFHQTQRTSASHSSRDRQKSLDNLFALPADWSPPPGFRIAPARAGLRQNDSVYKSDYPSESDPESPPVAVRSSSVSSSSTRCSKTERKHAPQAKKKTTIVVEIPYRASTPRFATTPETATEVEQNRPRSSEQHHNPLFRGFTSSSNVTASQTRRTKGSQSLKRSASHLEQPSAMVSKRVRPAESMPVIRTTSGQLDSSDDELNLSSSPHHSVMVEHADSVHLIRRRQSSSQRDLPIVRRKTVSRSPAPLLEAEHDAFLEDLPGGVTEADATKARQASHTISDIIKGGDDVLDVLLEELSTSDLRSLKRRVSYHIDQRHIKRSRSVSHHA